MAFTNSPSIVTNGLVFHYDMNNPKSWVGPPLTNILPNGINAGYPTVNSGWATYNTNQYGSGTYFSIGTISSVSGNIVTCNGHSLRTYDVVTPQTTGGGVSNGTSYLVRKWDANTFSLYAYDGTQESTTIFDVESNFNTDTRVAISSGITNMWWGPPHLPNSGIMKRIITNGFRWQGRVHDCMRIHWYRADGVTDGMAYGNSASITAGTTYTASFWVRAATPNAVGRNVYCEQYINGFDTGTTFTLQKSWTNVRIQFTSTQSGALNLYWFNSNCPAQSAWDISEIMVYAGTGQSKQYVTSGSTRSNTQSIIDLTGINTTTINNLIYAADGTFSFGGSGNYFDINSSTLISGNNPFTISSWYNNVSNGAIFGNYGTGYTSNTIWFFAGGLYLSGSYYITNYASRVSGKHNTCVTRDAAGNINVYFDGNLEGTWVNTNAVSTSQNYRIGADVNGGGEQFGGSIYDVKVYNRALSAAEVKQNFNAQRGRYGL